MERPTAGTASRRGDVAAVAIVLVGLQQGLVPLGLRLVIDHRERFALATYLPSPWWWIVCLVVMAAAAVLLLLVEGARGEGGEVARGEDVSRDGRAPKQGKVPADAARAPWSSDDAGSSASDERGVDVVSGFVLLIGIYNGLVPFVARLVFDTQLLLALPTRLDAPWWWIVSLAVCIATLVGLSWLDRAGASQSAERG